MYACSRTAFCSLDVALTFSYFLIVPVTFVALQKPLRSEAPISLSPISGIQLQAVAAFQHYIKKTFGLLRY